MRRAAVFDLLPTRVLWLEPIEGGLLFIGRQLVERFCQEGKDRFIPRAAGRGGLVRLLRQRESRSADRMLRVVVVRQRDRDDGAALEAEWLDAREDGGVVFAELGIDGPRRLRVVVDGRCDGEAVLLEGRFGTRQLHRGRLRVGGGSHGKSRHREVGQRKIAVRRAARSRFGERRMGESLQSDRLHVAQFRGERDRDDIVRRAGAALQPRLIGLLRERRASLRLDGEVRRDEPRRILYGRVEGGLILV